MRTVIHACLMVVFGLAGVVWAANSTTMLTVPNTGDSGITMSATETLATNEMRCTAFVASVGITNATKMSFYAVAGTASSVGVCLYSADGNTRIATTGTLTCGANTLCTKTGLTAFSLTKGTKYFVCWTSSDTTLQLAAAGSVNEDLHNTFQQNHGSGTNGTSGACPATMGALSTTFGAPLVPQVLLSVE